MVTYIFNVILHTGVFPEPWLIGIIKPIYKNKCKKNDPSNFRGIPLVSSFGKLVTAVLNMRLLKYLDSKEVLDQAGFRAGYSTTEHIFILYMIVEHFLSNGKKLYCAFVDYAKAVDTVWRQGLWFKLINNGIKGKWLAVIINM